MHPKRRARVPVVPPVGSAVPMREQTRPRPEAGPALRAAPRPEAEVPRVEAERRSAVQAALPTRARARRVGLRPPEVQVPLEAQAVRQAQPARPTSMSEPPGPPEAPEAPARRAAPTMEPAPLSPRSAGFPAPALLQAVPSLGWQAAAELRRPSPPPSRDVASLPAAPMSERMALEAPRRRHRVAAEPRA